MTAAKTDIEKTAPEKTTIIERLLAIAAQVGVLEPEKSGGVPFAFRGIDAVVAKLTPLLNEHGVIVVPTNTIQNLSQRDVGNKTVTKADVSVTYRFYGAAGDYIDVDVAGQADDFADRSTAQAMSVAFRIALLQTFHIAAFGNEEAASQDTMNAREAAGNAKVQAARASTQAAPSTKADPIESMRKAIVAAAGKKGWDGDAINAFANDVTGKPMEQWFENGDDLNLILSKINDAK